MQPGPVPEKSAILLTYLPANGRSNPAASREVKALLDRRRTTPHDAVSLLIVIRTAG